MRFRNIHSQLIIDECERKGIKCKALLLNEEELFLLEKHSQKVVINRAVSNRLKYLPGVISEDKNLCNNFLKHHGVNVPPFLKIFHISNEEKEFLHKNNPVVVKPFDTNKGVEIHMDIYTEEEFQMAFDSVKKVSEYAIVQRQVKGKDYRILIIDKKVAGVLWNEWPYIIGDGISSVEYLIQQENQRRRNDKIEVNGKMLSMLEDIDLKSALKVKEKLNVDIIPLGDKLYVSNCGNGWSGAIPHNVTEAIHPSILEKSLEVAKILDIDVAGIDVRCEDPSKPFEASGFNVIEVNIRPSLIEHMYPSYGKQINVLDMYLDYLFT